MKSTPSADSTPKGAVRHLTRRMFPRGLAWTRDGKSVVYTGGPAPRLLRVGVDGDAPPERIDIAGFDAWHPAIAVSRDRLAFMRLGSRQDIYRFEAGRPPVAVVASSFNDYSPHLSPDGQRLAFESARGGEGNEIWLAAADGANPSRLTHGQGLWQGSPHWSPDGHRIAFDSFGEDGQWDIWTTSADGGSAHRLTSNPADDNMPSWSHDGRFRLRPERWLCHRPVWYSPPRLRGRHAHRSPFPAGSDNRP